MAEWRSREGPAVLLSLLLAFGTNCLMPPEMYEPAYRVPATGAHAAESGSGVGRVEGNPWVCSGGGFDVGVRAAARSDVGGGTGLVMLVKFAGDIRGLYSGVGSGPRAELSRMVFENEDIIWNAGGEFAIFGGWDCCSMGVHLHWSEENGAWGIGPRIGIGVGAAGRHLELYLVSTAYLWLGADKNEAFTAGVEADIRLCAGVYF